MHVCRYLLPFQLADLYAEPFHYSHIACGCHISSSCGECWSWDEETSRTKKRRFPVGILEKSVTFCATFFGLQTSTNVDKNYSNLSILLLSGFRLFSGAVVGRGSGG